MTPSRLASEILLQGFNTRSEIVLTPAVDLAAFAGEKMLEEDMYPKVHRCLKLMARLNPWPAQPVERSFIDIGIGGGNGSAPRWYRFAVEFLSDGEKAVISAPQSRGELPGE